jgi:hypothetical protein
VARGVAGKPARVSFTEHGTDPMTFTSVRSELDLVNSRPD